MNFSIIKISEQDRRAMSAFMGEEYPNEIDFNWLMPVVDKIESLFTDGIMVSIKDKRCYIDLDTQFGMTDEGKDINLPKCYSGFNDRKIEAVCDSVIQFLEWYNTEKK